MHLNPEAARRLTEEVTKLYREHVSSEAFEDDFYKRNPKPKSLLWAGLVLGTFNAGVTPASLATIGAKIPDEGMPRQASSAKLEDAAPGSFATHKDNRRRPVSSDFAGSVPAYLFDLTVFRDDYDALGRLQTHPGEPIMIPCIATPGKEGHIRQIPHSVFGPAVVIARIPTTSPESRNAESSTETSDARLRWLQPAKFATGDGRFLAFDPGHYYPDPNPPDDATMQLLLEGQPGPVQIAIKCLSADATVAGVAGVRLLFSDATPTSREKVGTVDIESERMAIAPFGDLTDNWEVGGPRSQSSIVPSLRRIARLGVNTRDRMSSRARTAFDAAQVLENAGYEIDSGKRSYTWYRLLDVDTMVGYRCDLIEEG